MIGRLTLMTLSLVVFVGLAGLSAPSSAAVIDLTEADFEFDGSPWTLGWKFVVHEPVFATALGVYDSGQDGLADSALVGLWSATGEDPLVQATVPAGTDAELDGYFRLSPVTSTLLVPGTEYVVGAYLPGELATSFIGSNGLVDPRVTIIEARYSEPWSGFVSPGLTDPDAGGTALLGANLRVTPIPLPAAVWLFGSGIAGLVGLARGRKAAA
ncbi:MAG: DUF4082 domain-containing protein [Nitrospira sp.]|nr:DUF4082 domain-containing protein [Nitrospira sp.]